MSPRWRTRAVLWAITRRAMGFLATVAGAVWLVLALFHFAPGDAIDMLPNSEEVRPLLEEEWGLGDPLAVQYVRYLGRTLQGDLGTSWVYRPGQPVTELIAVPALRSLGWALTSMTLCIGLSLGFAWRRHRTRWLFQMLSVVPVFLLAHLLILGLNEAAWQALDAGWIERPSWFALPDQPSLLRTILAITVLAIGSSTFTDVYGELSSRLEKLRQSPFVDAARARGESVGRALAIHLIPLAASLVASRASVFLGGLIVLEKVFLLNGIGSILWQAALDRDYNVAMGITVVLGVATAALQWAGDVVRIGIDPRLSADGR